MKLPKIIPALFAAILPGAALAAPGDTMTAAGNSSAQIVDQLALQSLRNLRFGSFLRPAAAGTVTVAPNGSVTSTLDLTTFPTGRGAAAFLVRGTPNRQFNTFLPNNVTITNGTATMTVDNFRRNGGAGPVRLDSNGYFVLTVGARLQVGAAQQAGNYSGTFTVQVLYL